MGLLTLSGSYTKTFSDDEVFYFVSPFRVDIYSKTQYYPVATISGNLGFTDGWAEDAFIFLGTSGGLYSVEKPSSWGVSEDLSYKLVYEKNISEALSSESITCIAGIDVNMFVVGTVSGVDVVENKSNVYSSLSVSPVEAACLTEELDLYYGGGFGLAIKNAPISSSWGSPDFLLEYPFLPHTEVNDIESVTVSGDTLVGVATTSGMILIQARDPVFLSPTIKLFVG